MKYKSKLVMIGVRSPQIQIQLTPFQWAFGGGFGGKSLALAFGPLAIRLWFGYSPFEVAVNDQTYYPLRRTS